MITFDLNLGGVLSALQAVHDPRTVRQIVYAMAERYNDDIHDWIGEGRSFNASEGQLQQSINWRPLGDDGAQVYANAAYAEYVEKGTGVFAGRQQWVIRPKEGRKALKIPTAGGGGYFFRRSVIHKGSRPSPFFFADTDNRKAHLLASAGSVLAARVNQAGGQ